MTVNRVSCSQFLLLLKLCVGSSTHAQVHRIKEGHAEVKDSLTNQMIRGMNVGYRKHRFGTRNELVRRQSVENIHLSG